MYHNHRRRSLIQQLVALIVTTALLLQSVPLFAAPASAAPRTNNAITSQTRSNNNTTAADTAETTLLIPPTVPNGLDARAMALHNRTLATTIANDFALSTNNAPTAAALPLQPGWHLISLPEALPTTDPGDIFASITGSYSRVYAYDGCDAADPWKLYDPANPAGSDLTAIDHTMGLWIEMTAAATLAINGVQLNAASIPLCQGWNLIGYPIVEARLVDQALASIAYDYSRVFGFELTNVADPWAVFDPAVPTWANDLAYLEAGRGYWLYADAAATLTLTPPNTDAPVVEITAPSADALGLNGQIAVTGTVDDADLAGYTLTIAPIYQSEETVIATGSSVIINGQLGLLDTTLLANGLYILTLTATDSDGNVSTVSQPVQVQGGDNKPGNFSITFTDLRVPVSGIPIVINRTYDSRKRTIAGDFGYGWRMEVLYAGDYANNRPPGDGWYVTAGGGTFNPPCTTVHETKPHITEVRFSDLEYYRFALQINMYGFSSAVSGGCLGDASYVQVGGNPGASLTPLESADVLWTTGAATVLDFQTGETFEPQKVRLQTIDGREFDFDLDNGVERIADANGNTLFISENGVIHSSGKSISIVRNAEGRVTEIVDPRGNSITYAYNAAADLTGVTDRGSHTTTFAYSSDHFLTDIIDPLGNIPLRNEYDSSGRLVAQIDADGNRFELGTDLIANTNIITDRLGIVTVINFDENGFLNEADIDGQTVSATYDDQGNKLSETDGLGNTTSYTYDANNNLLSRTDPLNNTMARTIGPLNRMASLTDAAGNTTSYSYDAAGNLLTVRDDNNQVVESYTYDGAGNPLTANVNGIAMSYGYDSFGNRTSRQGANGLDESYSYDANGNQLTTTVKRTTAAGLQSETTTTTYDANNNPTTVTDPLGNVIGMGYNARNDVTSRTDGRGNSTTYSYDPRGNLVRADYCDSTFELYGYDLEDHRTAVTDRAGRTTFYEYDSQGRVKKIINPDGATITNVYDAAGNLVSTTDARNNTTIYSVDDAGRVTTITDPLGQVTTMGYNANGTLTSMTDATNRTTQYTYDESRLFQQDQVKTTYADGSFTTQSHTLFGELASTTDEAGNTTTYDYDGLGNLIEVIDALNQSTTYTYDQQGNVLTETDANGNTTAYAYDANGNLLQRTLPLGMVETFTYDANGNRLSHTDFNGQTTTYVYDCMNRLTQKNLPSGGTVSYSYTPAGEIKTITDSRGTTTFTYDARDRVTQASYPGGTTLSYTYDAAGNRTSVTSAAGTVNYTYDGANRLATVTDAQGGVTSYSYDAVGNRNTVTQPNGVVTTYGYDARHRLTSMEQRTAGGALLASYSYTLGAAGNRTKLTEASGRVVDYTYDALYRLTSESDTLSGLATTYSYDAVGNRLTKTVGGVVTSSTFDANNRLLTTGMATFVYDDNGNMTSRVDGGVTTLYSYDDEDRLIQQSMAGAPAIDLVYDDFGNLVRRTISGVTVNYVVDLFDNSGLAQVVAELDGSGALLTGYSYGDDLLQLRQSGATHYYHYDGVNSVRLLTDGSGAQSDSYSYDAFGNTVQSSGSTPNAYRFTGERYDANLGFYYLRSRYYSPELGRFVTQDRWPGNRFDPVTLHKYAYVYNNPVNLVDPTGQFGTLAGMSASVSVASILTSLTVSIMKFSLATAWVRLFFEPAQQMRHTALLMMGSGALSPHGWQEAMKLYRRGGFLLEWGSRSVDIASKAFDLVDMGAGFANLAKAATPATMVDSFDYRSFTRIAHAADRQAHQVFYRVGFEKLAPSVKMIRDWSTHIADFEAQFFRILNCGISKCYDTSYKPQL